MLPTLSNHMFFISLNRFSRFVLWLKLCTTNHRPEQTCSHFMEAVSNHCIPHSVRMDGGTENVRIILAQRYLCTGMPRLTTLPPVIVGSSNHNEVGSQRRPPAMLS